VAFILRFFAKEMTLLAIRVQRLVERSRYAAKFINLIYQQ
jgi:hypothetical protein